MSVLLRSQASRKLKGNKFSPSNSLQTPLPVGEVGKGLMVTIGGNFTTNAYTGTVIPHRDGIASALIRAMRVILDGGQPVKGVHPKWMYDLAKYVTGTLPAQFYKANSSTLGDSPTQGVPSAIAASQTLSFVECFHIPFELILASQPFATFLNLKNMLDARIEIDTNAFSSLNQGGTSTDFAITAHDINIEISLLTAPEMINSSFLTWVQAERNKTYTNAVTFDAIDLDTTGDMAGFFLRIASGKSGVETPINIDDADKVRFQLKIGTVMGSIQVKDFTLRDVMLENLAKTTMSTPISGTAYVNLLNNSDLSTALKTSREDGVQSVQLFCTLPQPSSLNGSPSDIRIAIRQDILSREYLNKNEAKK